MSERILPSEIFGFQCKKYSYVSQNHCLKVSVCFLLLKVVLFLLLALIVMVLCAAASMLTGLRYWLDGWHHTRERLDTAGKCSVKNNVCTCTDVAKMPLSCKFIKLLFAFREETLSTSALAPPIFAACLPLRFNFFGQNSRNFTS